MRSASILVRRRRNRKRNITNCVRRAVLVIDNTKFPKGGAYGMRAFDMNDFLYRVRSLFSNLDCAENGVEILQHKCEQDGLLPQYLKSELSVM